MTKPMKERFQIARAEITIAAREKNKGFMSLAVFFLAGTAARSDGLLRLQQLKLGRLNVRG